MKGFKKNGLKILAAKLPQERVERAKENAAKEIFKIRLAELRKKRNIRQTDIKSFTQSSLSKLETRKDMKISTLIEYLKSIGMGMEIKAYPKGKKQKDDVVVLVKV